MEGAAGLDIVGWALVSELGVKEAELTVGEVSPRGGEGDVEKNRFHAAKVWKRFDGVKRRAKVYRLLNFLLI